MLLPDTGTVELYADTLDARRGAALSVALVRLALATAALLLLFVVLAIVLSAAAEAEPRGEALGRLRSLGMRDRQMWNLLAGELSAPVVVGAVAGLLLGVGAAVTMFGRLALERITGQESPPTVSVTPWIFAGVAFLLIPLVVITHLEWRRLRTMDLGALLRGGPPGLPRSTYSPSGPIQLAVKPAGVWRSSSYVRSLPRRSDGGDEALERMRFPPD